MARFKDITWSLAGNETDATVDIQTIHAALLMDIRFELKRLNATLECDNTQSIPRLLRSIQRNTRRTRKVKP